MASSLLALLDDIATVLDDVAVLSKVAAKKTAGVLGDDLALNAQQVAGVSADRELPVVWAVARGSLVNKLILVPAALAISAWAPVLVAPLLMIGGAFLCYEGVEKLAHQFLHSAADDAARREQLAKALVDPAVDLVALERDKPAPAAPAPSGFEAFSMGAMGLYQNLAGGGDPAANGEAVITLPDGGSVSGSAPAAYTAPVHAASPLTKAPIAGLSNTAAIGALLYSRYLFLFESAGIILLVAMIGAIVLTHRERTGVRGQNVSRQVSRRPEEATINLQPEVGKGVSL
jgi:hypothetical protein